VFPGSCGVLRMRIEQFEKALEKDDFAIGDSFWLGDWEFEVVDRRIGEGFFSGDSAVFSWELTAEDFLQVIRDNHPEIDDAEGFFKQNKEQVIQRFADGFEALLAGSGANYGTIINDAVDEAISQDTEGAVRQTSSGRETATDSRGRRE